VSVGSVSDMTKRTLALLVVVLLLVAGAAYYWSQRRGAAADCGDKPKPKDAFTMAAACDGATEPAPAPKPQ
jgi:hypothetical protein